MLRRGLGALAAVTVLLAVAAIPASAHVTIQPPNATQGGFATEVFQVPNERDDAQTTMVEVTFPTDHPIAFVSVEPVPGWTVKVDKATLAKPIKSEGGDITEAVSKITWSGGAIEPGTFQRFPVSMGPLPDVDSLEFKAVQTYSSGEVVRWIDVASGDEEPEHPAPVLHLTAAADEATTATTAPAPSATERGDRRRRRLGEDDRHHRHRRRCGGRGDRTRGVAPQADRLTRSAESEACRGPASPGQVELSGAFGGAHRLVSGPDASNPRGSGGGCHGDSTVRSDGFRPGAGAEAGGHVRTSSLLPRSHRHVHRRRLIPETVKNAPVAERSAGDLDAMAGRPQPFNSTRYVSSCAPIVCSWVPLSPYFAASATIAVTIGLSTCTWSSTRSPPPGAGVSSGTLLGLHRRDEAQQHRAHAWQVRDRHAELRRGDGHRSAPIGAGTSTCT